MKKILLALMVLSLSGCATFDKASDFVKRNRVALGKKVGKLISGGVEATKHESESQ